MQPMPTQCDVSNLPETPRESRPQLRHPSSHWYEMIKVVIDHGLAIFLAVVTAPLLLLAALAVKLTSRGPILYFQTRLGRHGRPFSIYKIRTMYHNCERYSGVCWSQKGDPRVTLVGRFLRATHIDELPQLWNVLRGQMSLVGPRPERPEFYPGLVDAVPRYRERLMVLPGVTGLAQVQLAADSDIDSVRRKLALDLNYIEKLSFSLDCRILACTTLIMLGASYHFSRRLFAFPMAKPVETSSSHGDAGEPVKTKESLPEFSTRSAATNPEPQLESVCFSTADLHVSK